MSNVVEFPLSDRPIAETDIDALHAEAFRGLENRMMDCVRSLRSPIHGNCWKNSRRIIMPLGTTSGREDCIPPRSERAPPAINFLPEKQRDHPGRQRSHVRRPFSSYLASRLPFCN
jgi:hypothetical protein